jgi:hypothetical protein
LKKVMLLAAMLAMVLAAAVPALAQSVTQVGSGNQACVQTAINAEVGKVQISQYGDNINIQNIAQECNVSPAQVSSATAAPAAAPAAVQYQYAAPAAQQYSAPAASPGASPAASPAAALPPTGGSSLIALGAGVLLVAGGLLARRIVR